MSKRTTHQNPFTPVVSKLPPDAVAIRRAIADFYRKHTEEGADTWYTAPLTRQFALWAFANIPDSELLKLCGKESATK